MRAFILASILLIQPFSVRAEPPDRQCSNPVYGHQHCIRDAHFNFDLCQAVEKLSDRAGLNAGFFTRLIWQESRFDPNAQSPAGAEGIAQFIPSTAKLRKLEDVYNPAQALDASARYLAELARTFGNPGLAAVAYNAGEGAANGFTTNLFPIPSETRNYVRIITGLDAEIWRDEPPEKLKFSLAENKSFMRACLDLAKNRKAKSLRPDKPRLEPWGVQVASGQTRTKARSNFKRITGACSGLLKTERPAYVFKKYRSGIRKGYYAVRVGRKSRSAAARLCTKLRQNNCACAVYNNHASLDRTRSVRPELTNETAQLFLKPVSQPPLSSHLPKLRNPQNPALSEFATKQKRLRQLKTRLAQDRIRAQARFQVHKLSKSQPPLPGPRPRLRPAKPFRQVN